MVPTNIKFRGATYKLVQAFSKDISFSLAIGGSARSVDTFKEAIAEAGISALREGGPGVITVEVRSREAAEQWGGEEAAKVYEKGRQSNRLPKVDRTKPTRESVQEYNEMVANQPAFMKNSPQALKPTTYEEAIKKWEAEEASGAWKNAEKPWVVIAKYEINGKALPV